MGIWVCRGMVGHGEAVVLWYCKLDCATRHTVRCYVPTCPTGAPSLPLVPVDGCTSCRNVCARLFARGKHGCACAQSPLFLHHWPLPHGLGALFIHSFIPAAWSLPPHALPPSNHQVPKAHLPSNAAISFLALHQVARTACAGMHACLRSPRIHGCGYVRGVGVGGGPGAWDAVRPEPSLDAALPAAWQLPLPRMHSGCMVVVRGVLVDCRLARPAPPPHCLN